MNFKKDLNHSKEIDEAFDFMQDNVPNWAVIEDRLALLMEDLTPRTVTLAWCMASFPIRRHISNWRKFRDFTEAQMKREVPSEAKEIMRGLV